VSSLNIFNRPVTGFNTTDLTLTCNSGVVPLTGASLTSADNITWTLGGLENLTATAGSYAVKLTEAGSGIQDTMGHALSNDADVNWIKLGHVPSITDQPPPFSNNTSANFTFTDSDPLTASLEVSLDNSPFITAASPQTYTNLGEGPHTFQVRARSQFGNVGEQVSYTWIVDTTAPTASPIYTGTLGTNNWYKTIGKVNLAPADGASGVASTIYWVDGGREQTYNGAFALSGDGTHTIEYTVVDRAGNRLGTLKELTGPDRVVGFPRTTSPIRACG
jgi:hypothetical protein